MKKLIIFVILLLIPISIKAADMKDITLKWEEHTGETDDIIKKDGYYYLFAEKEIIKFKSTTNNQIKKYTNGTWYRYYLEDNKIYLFYYSYDRNEYCIKIMDMDFNVIDSTFIKMGDIFYYKDTGNKYIFVGNSNPSNKVYYLVYVELDKDLNEIVYKKYSTNQDTTYVGKDDNGTYYFMDNYYEGRKYYKYDGEFSTMDSLGFSSDTLERETFYNFINSKRKNYYEQEIIPEATYNAIVAKIPKKYNDTEMRAQIKKDGENYVALLQEYKSSFQNNEDIILYEKNLLYLDKNLNEKWRITYPEERKPYTPGPRFPTNSIFNVHNGNIVVSTNETKSLTIEIYNNKKEKLLDVNQFLKLSNEHSPIYLDFSETGLLLIFERVRNAEAFTSANGEKVQPTLLNNPMFLYAEGFSYGTSIFYLDINYHVHTKVVSGKGNIKVNKSLLDSNEEVEFIVEPEPGYVLGEVRVTDSNGKTIVFKNNRFTMPSSDVTIEAVFLPIKNPATKDIAILTIAILGITAGAVILLNHKKVKEIS